LRGRHIQSGVMARGGNKGFGCKGVTTQDSQVQHSTKKGVRGRGNTKEKLDK